MYLGFDLGTTNVKALVVDDAGRIASSGSASVDRVCTFDGGVEQDIEQIWSATGTAIRQAVEPLDAARVRAIGVSSQGGALQVVDGDDRPLGPVISWLDSRGLPFDRELNDELGGEFLAAHTGHAGSLMTLGQVLRLRRQSPEMLAPPRRLGFVGDLIVGRLCGRRAHDPTSLGIAMLYNPGLDRADPQILARLGLHESQLPDLLTPTCAAGTLLPDAAQHLGLPPGIPVSPAIHDQYAAGLGAGAAAAGDINCGTGTAWVLLANTDRLTPPVCDKAFVCRHPIAGLFGQMLSLGNGGSAIEWVMKLVGRQRASPTEVDALLESVPAGSAGVRCWPLLMPSAQADRPFDRGGRFDALTLGHEPCHLVRAVVEGLACELVRHLRFLTAAGLAASRLTLCGTAAASRVTPQIIADVADLPVACVETSDVSAFGAAMIAYALVERGVDLAALSRRWASGGRTLQPGPNAGVYREMLAQYLAPFAGREGA